MTGARTVTRAAADRPSGRIRVAFCIDNLGEGGTELNAVRTAERLPRDRIEPALVALDARGPLRERYEKAGVPIEEFAFPSFLSAECARQGLRLRRWLRESRIDVVHAHDIYSNIFAVPWARSAGVPLVIASRRWGREPSRARRLANRWANRLAHRVIANSSRGEEILRAEGVAPARIRRLPNFLEEAAFDTPPAAGTSLRAELGLPAAARVIGIVANLTPAKDHDTLIRGFARVAADLPDWYVVGFGEGPERPALQARLGELGLADRFRLPGRRPNRPNLHAGFDISALVSPDEGSPNSLLEAMAAGRPVVATRVGGIPELVVHGESGLLVPPGDPESLGAALKRLATDEALRQRMGRAGLDRARARFSEAAVLGDLLGLYAEGTAGAGPARAPAAEAGVS